MTLAIGSIPTWWYITYERELGNGKSITLQPLFTTGEFDPEFFDAGEDENPIEVSQFGLMGSYRIYTNGEKSRGHYFAPALMFSKLTVSQEGNTYESIIGPVRDEDIEITGTTFAALVYTGYRGKSGSFTWYIDAGIGFQKVSLDITGDNSDFEEIEDLSKTGLAVDVNYGIGFAF